MKRLKLENFGMGNGIKLIHRGDVVELRFNRPEALNTLTLKVINAFAGALIETEKSQPRCLLITGEGRNFMAGGDLAYLEEAGDNAPVEAAKVIDALNIAMKQLARMPCPTLIAVQGAVAGAGFSLTLACDMAIAADNARFVFAYDKIGATPDGGLSWNLPRAVGMRRALAIAMSGEPISGESALSLGLVAQVVAHDAFEKIAQDMAVRLAQGPTLAYVATRQLMLDGLDRNYEDHLTAERESFSGQAATLDFRAAVEAFFARQQPQYKGN
jgi:2-(1,2-epoxy-1,2-dihydrophenyl)acetyl-CoA isomerase